MLVYKDIMNMRPLIPGQPTIGVGFVAGGDSHA